MSSRAEQVARAILYEGYILYPYRPSSVKNQHRWNFGVVYPPGSSDGAAAMQTQCLARVASGGAAAMPVPELDVKICFLHLLDRSIRELDIPVHELPQDGEPPSHPLQRLECEGRMLQSWQEGVEREILLPDCSLQDLMTAPRREHFSFAGSRTVEPLRNAQGDIAWLVVREHQPLSGWLEVSAEDLGDDLVRLTVVVQNTCPPLSGTPGPRDAVLLRSFASAHKILTVRGADFLSLIDPPESCHHAAEACRNIGTWPVLAGEADQRDTMLSSPIILYDYPQIAPESPGDLCDGTEIDEILSLRILTLTDEEKREMRQSDERGRRILERTETLPEEQWLKLHGILRGLRPATEVIQ